MLIQVFKVIKGPKLRAMLTSVLKDIDLTDLDILEMEFYDKIQGQFYFLTT